MSGRKIATTTVCMTMPSQAMPDHWQNQTGNPYWQVLLKKRRRRKKKPFWKTTTQLEKFISVYASLLLNFSTAISNKLSKLTFYLFADITNSSCGALRLHFSYVHFCKPIQVVSWLTRQITALFAAVYSPYWSPQFHRSQFCRHSNRFGYILSLSIHLSSKIFEIVIRY